MSEFSFSPVGFIRSPWQEKFAIPRQPGLVEDGTRELHFVAPYNHADCVRGLEQFSHVWVIFVFHDIPAGSWRPLVRPPRLGGNAKMGVFATRSTFRPNPIGMSLVELKKSVTTAIRRISPSAAWICLTAHRCWISNPICPMLNPCPAHWPVLRRKSRRRICRSCSALPRSNS